MAYSYQIIRSARKTVTIEIRPDGKILVRCPNRMRTEDVRRFVQSKEDWIGKHLPRISEENLPKYTLEELEQLRKETRTLVTRRAAHFAPLAGVTYNQIAVRAQRTRWGSCSSKGNLNFNCLLALMPSEVLDYVVVHELCHRKEMNHSPAFWNLVAQILPDYKSSRVWLREHGANLMARL